MAQSIGPEFKTQYHQKKNKGTEISIYYHTLYLKDLKLVLVISKNTNNTCQAWWQTSIIPALRRLRQEEDQEFGDSLGHIMSSGQPRLHSKTPISKTKQINTNKEKKVQPQDNKSIMKDSYSINTMISTPILENNYN
jgi:hypothetical protein